MPNYSIPTMLREHIKTQALKLANRSHALAMSNFPLNVQDLQYNCAALTADQVNTLRQLDSDGVRTIEHHKQLRLAFIRENLPELRRGVVLHLQLPEWIVVGRGTQWGIGTTKFQIDENHYIVPDMNQLAPSLRAALVTWINQALRQHRLFEITSYMLDQALDHKYTPTTSHLHAFWPALTTLVDPTTAFGRNNKDQVARWQERFRNPTRSLRAYRPNADVYNKFAKFILAADTVLAAGMVLPDVHKQKTDIAVSIEHWERIAGDPTFPLPD
jgi:hypothetical protein